MIYGVGVVVELSTAANGVVVGFSIVVDDGVVDGFVTVVVKFDEGIVAGLVTVDGIVGGLTTAVEGVSGGLTTAVDEGTVDRFVVVVDDEFVDGVVDEFVTVAGKAGEFVWLLKPILTVQLVHVTTIKI